MLPACVFLQFDFFKQNSSSYILKRALSITLLDYPLKRAKLTIGHFCTQLVAINKTSFMATLNFPTNTPEVFEGQCAFEVTQYFQEHPGPVTAVAEFAKV